MILIEACVTSLSEALEAACAGAHRLELCHDLARGGLTPASDLVSAVRAQVHIPLFVMVRPGAGSFSATPRAVTRMLRQTAELVALGVDGVVLGVLNGAGHVDVSALRELVNAAGTVSVTFHRAFDEVARPLSAIEDLANAGVSRVLTGGGPGTAWEGREMLRELARVGGERVTILAGGHVRGDHVARLVEETGVKELHARGSAIPGIVAALRHVEP